MVSSKIKQEFFHFIDNYGAVFAVSLSFLLNIIFYYLGLAFNDNKYREYLFIICKIVFFCSSIFVAIRMWTLDKKYLSVLLLACGILFFLGITVLISLLRTRMYGRIFDFSSKFVIFCIPALIFGISLGFKNGQDFVFYYEKSSFVILPAVVSYVIMNILGISPFSNYGLGIANYMSIAYGIMPFLFVLIYAYLFKLASPIKFVATNQINIIRFITVLFSAAAIIISGTRGAIFAVCIFLLSLIIVLVVNRLFIKRIIILSISLIILFSSLFFFLNGRPNNLTERLSIFIEGLEEGKLVTSDGDLKEHELEKLLNMPINNWDNEELQELKQKVTNRGSIFKIAIKEAIRNPWLGLGAMGYSLKYGGYPHNIVLQIFAEYGFIFGSIMVLFILWCIGSVIYILIKERRIHFIIFLFAGYLFMYSSSSSFWYAEVLFLGIGYALALRKSYKEANMAVRVTE